MSVPKSEPLESVTHGAMSKFFTPRTGTRVTTSSSATNKYGDQARSIEICERGAAVLIAMARTVSWIWL